MNIYATSGVVNTSDGRLKENIHNLAYGLETVMQLRPVSYTWRNQSNSPIKLGLIAQEVQSLIPEVVKVGDDINRTLGIYYSDLVPVTIKAIQEQQGSLNSLSLNLNSLGNVVSSPESTSLLSRVTALEQKSSTQSGTFTDIIFNNGTVNLNMTVMGQLQAQGAFIAGGNATFQGNTVFEQLSTFMANVVFRGSASFEKVPTFNRDTAGIAMIRNGDDKVDVVLMINMQQCH